MRTFWMSFAAGIILALGVELKAQDDSGLDGLFASEERLPAPAADSETMPLSSSNSTSSFSQNQVRKSDIIHASRVERAKQVAQNWLEIEMMTRQRGINTARPLVNAGFIYSAPIPNGYRWAGPNYLTYGMPYGVSFPQ